MTQMLVNILLTLTGGLCGEDVYQTNFYHTQRIDLS